MPEKLLAASAQDWNRNDAKVAGQTKAGNIAVNLLQCICLFFGSPIRRELDSSVKFIDPSIDVLAAEVAMRLKSIRFQEHLVKSIYCWLLLSGEGEVVVVRVGGSGVEGDCRQAAPSVRD